MAKVFSKAAWSNLWRRMLASNLWHRAMLCIGILILITAILAAVYYYVMPRISYRQLTNSVISEGSVASAKVTRGKDEFELNDMQILAVVSWLADYRSDNKGITHASEWEGSVMDLTLESGRQIKLFIEPSAIVFEGLFGEYRIKVDYNELYYLVNNLSNG